MPTQATAFYRAMSSCSVGGDVFLRRAFGASVIESALPGHTQGGAPGRCARELIGLFASIKSAKIRRHVLAHEVACCNKRIGSAPTRTAVLGGARQQSVELVCIDQFPVRAVDCRADPAMKFFRLALGQARHAGAGGGWRSAME
jgi:hypothetical protein